MHNSNLKCFVCDDIECDDECQTETMPLPIGNSITVGYSVDGVFQELAIPVEVIALASALKEWRKTCLYSYGLTGCDIESAKVRHMHQMVDQGEQ